MLGKICPSSYLDKYTFIIIWKFSFDFGILGLLRAVHWNMVAWEGKAIPWLAVVLFPPLAPAHIARGLISLHV